MEDNIRLCNHCFNTTSHQLIVKGDIKKIKGESKVNGKTEPTIEPFTYFLVKCETCGDYSFLGGFNNQLPDPKLVDIPVLFPKPNKLDSSVPENIRRVYEEAAQIKNKLPSAYATQIRRALEYLCIDKKAKGNNLNNQLKSLVGMGIIPLLLNDMTEIIRLVGNTGAHAKEDEVTHSDVKDIDDFFRFIIEYVYVAPAKTETVKFNLKRRQLISKYGGLIYEVEWVLQREQPTTLQELDYDQQFEEGPRDSYYPYEYTEEAVLIVEKLKDIHTETELRDYFYKEPNFVASTWEIETISNAIWDLWKICKGK